MDSKTINRVLRQQVSERYSDLTFLAKFNGFELLLLLRKIAAGVKTPQEADDDRRKQQEEYRRQRDESERERVKHMVFQKVRNGRWLSKSVLDEARAYADEAMNEEIAKNLSEYAEQLAKDKIEIPGWFFRNDMENDIPDEIRGVFEHKKIESETLAKYFNNRRINMFYKLGISQQTLDTHRSYKTPITRRPNKQEEKLFREAQQYNKIIYNYDHKLRRFWGCNSAPSYSFSRTATNIYNYTIYNSYFNGTKVNRKFTQEFIDETFDRLGVVECYYCGGKPSTSFLGTRKCKDCGHGSFV